MLSPCLHLAQLGRSHTPALLRRPLPPTLVRSERYLSSVEAADDVTRQVLRVYARHGVQPLVETEVATDEHVQHVRQLLASAAEEQPGPPALPHRAA